MNRTVQDLVGLCVPIDDEPPVCVACAERIANDGGFPVLFWMCNKPKACPGADICPECEYPMDNKWARYAADRVAQYLQPNANAHVSDVSEANKG